MSAMKGFVMLSRFTPNLQNAEDVALQKGDVVTWRGKTGKVEQVVIRSALKQHESGLYGYEVVFQDGLLRFVDECQIINWEGKT